MGDVPPTPKPRRQAHGIEDVKYTSRSGNPSLPAFFCHDSEATHLKLKAEATGSPLRCPWRNFGVSCICVTSNMDFRVCFRHFVKAADQSSRLEERCSSARRAPSSCNDSSSFQHQSAGYVWNPGYRHMHTHAHPCTHMHTSAHTCTHMNTHAHTC